jgi:hypothetical protein
LAASAHAHLTDSPIEATERLDQALLTYGRRQ